MRELEKGELSNFEEKFKLIKTVYGTSAFTLGYKPNESLDFVLIKNLTSDFQDYFNNSLFMVKRSEFIDELINVRIDYDSMKDALSDKVKFINKKDNSVYLSGGKSNKIFKVAMTLSDKILNKEYLKALDLLRASLDQNIESENTIVVTKEQYTSTIIQRLLDNEIVTIRPDDVEMFPDFALIVTKKSFPNIKKMNKLKIQWIGEDDYDIVQTNVSAVFLNDKISFIHSLYTLKC